MFFFTGLTILILGIAMAGFSPDHKTPPLAMTITAIATVFLIVISVVTVGVRQELEEFTAPQLGESWRYRIEHIEI